MDMLIDLSSLPPMPRGRAGSAGVTVRKPIGAEHDRIVDWIARAFSAGWASEARVALANRPVTLLIALAAGPVAASAAAVPPAATPAASGGPPPVLRGFCCYDATARGFVGPVGVDGEARGSGIGAALLRACLDDMRAAGYGYAVAGWVGPRGFFRRVAGAVEIAGSDAHGLYRDMLR